MDDQAQIEKGQAIIKAVYKASLKALFAIGVKSPENVDKFSLHFSQELDKEFLKIGLFESPIGGTARENPYPSSYSEKINDGLTIESIGIKYDDVKNIPTPKLKNTKVSVKALGLTPLTVATLKRAGILTVEELMDIMQKDSLTSIRGIAEKTAQEILQKFAKWNQL